MVEAVSCNVVPETANNSNLFASYTTKNNVNNDFPLHFTEHLITMAHHRSIVIVPMP